MFPWIWITRVVDLAFGVPTWASSFQLSPVNFALFTLARSVQPIVLCVGNIARQILPRYTSSIDSEIIHARVVAIYFHNNTCCTDHCDLAVGDPSSQRPRKHTTLHENLAMPEWDGCSSPLGDLNGRA